MKCSLSRLVVFSKVLAARKTKFITARARKKRRSDRVLANARKDHSIPLLMYVACFLFENSGYIFL